METTKTKYNYYSTFNGKISRSFNEKPKDLETVERINKSLVTKYEQYFDSINEVFLTGVKIKKDKFGESLEIKFNSDAYGASILTVGIKSNYYRCFMERLPNIDLSLPVTINVWTIKADDPKKDRHGFWMAQNGRKVAKFYSKETPNGLPQPNILVVNKENVFDWSAQMDFYEDLLKKTFTDFSRADYTETGRQAYKESTLKEDGYVNNHAEFAKSQEGKSTQKTPIDIPVIVDDEKLPWEQ